MLHGGNEKRIKILLFLFSHSKTAAKILFSLDVSSTHLD
jgi:predicted transcriptional regulator